MLSWPLLLVSIDLFELPVINLNHLNNESKFYAPIWVNAKRFWNEISSFRRTCPLPRVQISFVVWIAARLDPSGRCQSPVEPVSSLNNKVAIHGLHKTFNLLARRRQFRISLPIVSIRVHTMRLLLFTAIVVATLFRKCSFDDVIRWFHVLSINSQRQI